MKITLKQIEVFVAIAQLGSMTRAADTVYLTQSACSMALSNLEAQLGGSLFDRQGKKLQLNERGTVLLPQAVNLIAQMQTLQNTGLKKGQAMLSGHLVVGASTTIGNYVLPSSIGHFVEAHPQTKITLRIENTEQIIQQLLQFRIDVGFIEGNCLSEQIQVLPWKKDQLIVVAAAKHSLAKKQKLTPKDLQQASWILREPGSGTREKFEESIGHKINPFLELGSTEAIKQAVLEGFGISCLSKATVADALASRRLVELKVPFLKLTRDFFILLHREKYQGNVLHAFLEGVS